MAFRPVRSKCSIRKVELYVRKVKKKQQTDYIFISTTLFREYVTHSSGDLMLIKTYGTSNYKLKISILWRSVTGVTQQCF